MDKLKLAHEYLLKTMRETAFVDESDICFFVDTAWKYADAMQAEAEKRVNKERPESLCDVDWSQAPNDAIGWMIFDGVSTWLGESGYLIEDAPTFSFTGSHIVERPHGF